MEPPDRLAGMCGDCRHCRRVRSARGSLFILCDLGARGGALPKYPRLPVLECVGYERREPEAN